MRLCNQNVQNVLGYSRIIFEDVHKRSAAALEDKYPGLNILSNSTGRNK